MWSDRFSSKSKASLIFLFPGSPSFFQSYSSLTAKRGGKSRDCCVHLPEDAPIAGQMEKNKRLTKTPLTFFFFFQSFCQIHSQAAIAPTQCHHPGVSSGGKFNPGAFHGLQSLVVRLRVTCSHGVHPPPKNLGMQSHTFISRCTVR